MGEPAARVSAGAALDAFFDAYYRRRPVTATFTGVHEHDAVLPDWSPAGLAAAIDEMHALRRTLAAAGCPGDAAVGDFPEDVDLALADAFLEIQIAEHEGTSLYRSNAAIWTGEAIFAVLSLVTRDFAPLRERLEHAAARLEGIPAFLHDARSTIAQRRPMWDVRARRECATAVTLFGETLPAWAALEPVPASVRERFAHAAAAAAGAFADFRGWLEQGAGDKSGTADAGTLPSEALLSLLLRRGHFVDESPAALLVEARDALDEAAGRLETLARPHGGWLSVQEALAGLHPGATGYLGRFQEIWDDCRAAAGAADLVTWPDAPVRYVPIPAHTREAAPQLYYLFYRSPAPFDPIVTYDYVVPPIDASMPAATVTERLRATNDSVIKLNHVVHHGAIGHHVQNHHAFRGRSRIGQVAAVDAASRIGMFCGGSMAEGWACYVCDLMESVGFLTPLESVAQQQTRVRLAARAVVDLAMHTGQMTLAEAAALYRDRAAMPEAAAQSEAVKNSMFPGAAVMYWLGTRRLHALGAEWARQEGPSFSPRRFHDRVLAHGSIPVALVARLMTSRQGERGRQ